MAEANTSSSQQSFDAQQMDNQAMEQAPADGASGAAGEARADAPVSTPSTSQPDGPSLLNNTTDPKNNTAEQRARGADSELGTGETNSNPRDGGGNANNNLGGPEGQSANLNPNGLTATTANGEGAPQQDGGGQSNGGQNGVSVSTVNAPSGGSGGARGGANNPSNGGNGNTGNGTNNAGGEGAGNTGNANGNTGGEGSQAGPANATPTSTTNTTPIEPEAEQAEGGNLGGGRGTPNDPTAYPENTNSEPSAIPTLVSFNKNSETISVNTSAKGNVLNDDSSNGVVLAVKSFTVEGQTYQAGETVTLDGIGTLNIKTDGTYEFKPENVTR